MRWGADGEPANALAVLVPALGVVCMEESSWSSLGGGAEGPPWVVLAGSSWAGACGPPTAMEGSTVVAGATGPPGALPVLGKERAGKVPVPMGASTGVGAFGPPAVLGRCAWGFGERGCDAALDDRDWGA